MVTVSFYYLKPYRFSFFRASFFTTIIPTSCYLMSQVICMAMSCIETGKEKQILISLDSFWLPPFRWLKVTVYICTEAFWNAYTFLLQEKVHLLFPSSNPERRKRRLMTEQPKTGCYTGQVNVKRKWRKEGKLWMYVYPFFLLIVWL